MSKPLWQQHTSTMLRWAAIRTGARVVFADAIAGCYMEDEIPVEDAQLVPKENPEPAKKEGRASLLRKATRNRVVDSF